jgi:pilus assembly protein CpaE
MGREDTIVSRLPNRFLRAATQVSQVRQLAEIDPHGAPPPRIDPSAARAMAALDALQPSAPRPPMPPPGYAQPPAYVRQPPLRAPAPEPEPPRPTPAPALAMRGKVICMFGCRGGAGATTLAVNAAAGLARAGNSVCLMDLDLQLGDVFVALDLEPETSIAALAREASTIDGAALKRRLARHDAGFYAVTQTGRIDDIDEHLVERMPALLATLTTQFDYVIVDGIRDFGDYALSVLDMADAVALVATQDVASVRRAARVITLFRQLGYGDRKLKLVVNRATRRAPVNDAEIARALGMPVTARVRNDYRRVRAALDDGALIGDVARGSGVAKDLVEVTEALAAPASREEA